MKGKIASFLLLLAVSIVFVQPAHCQEGLKLGFVALPQTTWMLNKDDLDAPLDEFDYKLTWGMAAGPTIGYNFTDLLGFRMNFLYSVQGQEYSNNNSLGELVNHTRRLHYLKVPLLFNFNTSTEFSKLIFTVQAGYQASVLLNARYYNDDQSYVPDPTLNPNIYEWPDEYGRYNIIDHGPVVNLGLDIKLTYNVMANIHLRADYSIRDAEDKDIGYKEVVNGIPTQRLFWDQERNTTNHLTGGLLIGITYTLTNN